MTLLMLPVDHYAVSFIHESQCLTFWRVICRLFKAVILAARRRLGNRGFLLLVPFGWLDHLKILESLIRRVAFFQRRNISVNLIAVAVVKSLAYHL